MAEFASRGSAVNIIPRNFFRRDLRSDEDVLIARSVDRCVRPLMGQNQNMPVVLTGRLLAAETSKHYDAAAINAASAALTLSDIPWKGPLGEAINVPQWLAASHLHMSLAAFGLGRGAMEERGTD